MTTGDNDEAQAPDLPETEDENHQNDRAGDQEELLDDQGKTEPRQNDARGYQSPISRMDIIPVIRTDFGLPTPELNRILSSARLLDPLLSSLTKSVIGALVRPSIINTPQISLTSAFPSTLASITQGLAENARALNLLSPSLIPEVLPRVSIGIFDALPLVLDLILKPFPILVHPKAQLASELGWVVHHSLPIDLLDNVHDDDLDEAIMAHYRAKWSDFRRETELDTNEYLVDQDTKETVIQALQAHESGLYRLVSRTLMAEIERVIRVQLRGKIVGRGLNVKETILSEVDDLPMPSFHDLTSSTMQYEAFEGHLYEQIDDENDRSRFADNPIPNRHAALHGLVPYSSEKSSLNSIFLMDFVLQTTTQAKRARIAEAADILKGYITRNPE